jgi:hypothetical protein
LNYYFLVSLAVAIFSVVLAVFVFRKSSMNKLGRVVIATYLIGFSVIVSGLTVLLWSLYWHGFLYEGPFHGIQRTEAIITEPIQQFQIHRGFVLEVFEKRDTDKAPTVRLKGPDGVVRWIVFAAPETIPSAQVNSITFEDWQNPPFFPAKITATVQWGPGDVSSRWTIDDSGNLIEFWYSGG